MNAKETLARLFGIKPAIFIVERKDETFELEACDEKAMPDLLFGFFSPSCDGLYS
jgi:hypothetical protein